jgi:DegV family protein with EDD domain
LPEIVIVTDSVACLPRELIEQHGIEIIPITIFSGGKVYRDWVDITPSQAYELFLQDPESFKTAPATPLECLETFRRASLRAKSILCISVSSKISTMYNVA